MGSAFIPSSNTPTTVSVTVTSSSAEALAANPTVRYRSFKNASQSVACWLGQGVPAVVGFGICIEPRGTYEMAYQYQNMYPGEIFAISEGGNVVLAILEHSPNT